MHGTYQLNPRASGRLLSLAVLVAAAACPPQNAAAQGFLDRIESRVRSRIEAYRAAPPPAEQAGPEQRPPSYRDTNPRNRDADPRNRDADPRNRDADPRNRSTPTLGVEARASSELITGVQIMRFFSHSQAEDAGLRPGDLVVSINGAATPSIAAIGQELSRHEIGDSVLLAVVRSGQLIQMEVPLVENLLSPQEQSRYAPRYGTDSRRWIPPVSPVPPSFSGPRPSGEPLPYTESRGGDPEPYGDPEARGDSGPRDTIDDPPLPEAERVPSRNPEPRSEPTSQSPQRTQPSPSSPETAIDSVLGVEVTDDPESRGATIRNVNPSSPAAKAGLRANDRIVAVDGRVVRHSDDLQRQIARYESGRTVTLQAVRGDAFVELDATLVDPSDATAEMPAAAPTTESSTETPSSKPKGSFLNSLGSTVGGLFGDKPAKPAEPGKETSSPDAANKPPASEQPRKASPADESAADKSADDQESAAEELPAPATSDPE